MVPAGRLTDTPGRRDVSRRDVLCWGAAGLALAPNRARAGQTSDSFDVLGRRISRTAPVRRVLLGEGRQILAVGAMDRSNPFGRVVGWRDDLIRSDPDCWRQYRAVDPAAAELPFFNGMRDGALDVERAIGLRPDVILLNLEAEPAATEANLVERVEKLGIQVAYIDFRGKPYRNTEPSLRLMGWLMGRQQVAADIIAFRAAEIARVTDRIAQAERLRRPLVMLDRIPGYSDGCCDSFGKENFGHMVEMAGGHNLGSEIIPGTFGTIDPETVLAADPDVVISTGSHFGTLELDTAWIGLGPGADLVEARRKLALAMQRPAFAGSKAVREGRVHAIWHPFYNIPYQFVALQCIAKWLHPDLFADLDPEATFKTLHDRFLPVPYEPGYWVDLERRA